MPSSQSSRALHAAIRDRSVCKEVEEGVLSVLDRVGVPPPMKMTQGSPWSTAWDRTIWFRSLIPDLDTLSFPKASLARASTPAWNSKTSGEKPLTMSSPSCTRSRYSESPAPAGSGRSKSLATFLNGKFASQWTEIVRVPGVSRRVAAVPSP